MSIKKKDVQVESRAMAYMYVKCVHVGDGHVETFTVAQGAARNMQYGRLIIIIII